MDFSRAALEEILTEVRHSSAWDHFSQYLKELLERLNYEVWLVENWDQYLDLRGAKKFADSMSSYPDVVSDHYQESAIAEEESSNG